ncbi:PKD domain-containing protein [Acanthamoeba castellanii medusavirus]|uniref:PKD domain-containing protein n=1 Tax=Acanthamoeba castellanii medusavirus J1 TaxID=3114988 RepID=A0A3T1CWQ7_9VIRU|nr:PKD domain-containing protein [Acanthamoeba castellanii medusavirus]BBI30263.1 PKD domain-containing protein [Acanthamoeba castellanii medusavirus J1]
MTQSAALITLAIMLAVGLFAAYMLFRKTPKPAPPPLDTIVSAVRNIRLVIESGGSVYAFVWDPPSLGNAGMYTWTLTDPSGHQTQRTLPTPRADFPTPLVSGTYSITVTAQNASGTAGPPTIFSQTITVPLSISNVNPQWQYMSQYGGRYSFQPSFTINNMAFTDSIVAGLYYPDGTPVPAQGGGCGPFTNMGITTATINGVNTGTPERYIMYGRTTTDEGVCQALPITGKAAPGQRANFVIEAKSGVPQQTVKVVMPITFPKI